MFGKPYKVKSHNNLKGSARKSLVQKIQAAFPCLNEDDLKELVPLKAPLSSMKVSTHSGEDVGIHIVDSIPIMMEMFDVLYPTVFAMWRCPHMLPSLTIFNTVASRFQDGIYHVTRGHLYIPPRGVRLPLFKKGALVSVNMTDNKAAILVGIAGYCTADLPQVVRGQCVKTLQMFGDLLCKFEKFTRVERPKLGAPYVIDETSDSVAEDMSNLEIDDEDLSDNSNESPTRENDVPGTDGDHPKLSLPESPVKEVKTVDENGFPLDMDELLRYCLLSVIKTQGKKMVLPLKTNLLYANHMTTFCPSERSLDVKKSSYKKMAKFLEAMEKEGILQVQPIEKGVDAIVKVEFAHPSIKAHNVITESESGVSLGKKSEDSPTFSAPAVKEMYKITAAVLPLFEPMNFKRGQAVTGSQVTNVLVAYVRRNNLQNPNDKTLVNVDPHLSHITNADVHITWENLKSTILKKMTNCTEMTFADGSSTVNTGKLPMITMQVANRSGNKKVTLVSNLHYYGISLAALSKECQHGVAASCSITKSPGSKFDQLLVQGNQTYFLAKHLTEFYKLPKRFIEGAEKALASKKK